MASKEAAAIRLTTAYSKVKTWIGADVNAILTPPCYLVWRITNEMYRVVSGLLKRPGLDDLDCEGADREDDAMRGRGEPPARERC